MNEISEAAKDWPLTNNLHTIDEKLQEKDSIVADLRRELAEAKAEVERLQKRVAELEEELAAAWDDGFTVGMNHRENDSYPAERRHVFVMAAIERAQASDAQTDGDTPSHEATAHKGVGG